MKKSYVSVLVSLSLLFLVLAIYYWVTPAKSLPSFFPGHQALVTKHHLKHGLASLILSAAFGVWAWFSSGGKATSPKSKPTE